MAVKLRTCGRLCVFDVHRARNMKDAVGKLS